MRRRHRIRPNRKAISTIPACSNLDRGVYNGRNNADGADGAPTDDLALLWLDDGVYDEDGAVAGTPHTSIDTDGLERVCIQTSDRRRQPR